MPETLTQQQKVDYAALADQVYVRDPNLDQNLSLDEINSTFQEIASSFLSVPSLRRPEDSFYYYSDNGFVAHVVKDGDNYIVVFRGVDAATGLDFDIQDMITNAALG